MVNKMSPEARKLRDGLLALSLSEELTEAECLACLGAIARIDTLGAKNAWLMASLGVLLACSESEDAFGLEAAQEAAHTALREGSGI
jgi:hypothetical protein